MVYCILISDDSKRLNQSLQNISQTLRNASTPGPPSRENSQIKVPDLYLMPDTGLAWR